MLKYCKVSFGEQENLRDLDVCQVRSGLARVKQNHWRQSGGGYPLDPFQIFPEAC